jgi:hypothetical protein
MVDTVFVLVSAACYSQRIAPAASRFSSSGDSAGIVSLLRQGQQRLRGVPLDQHPFVIGGETFDPMQDALDVMEGREFYGPSTNHVPPTPGARTSRADLNTYIETQVYPFLFPAVCVAYDAGVPARQVLTRGRLLPYLYEHSSVLEDAFTGGLRGEPLPLLPSMELLSRSVVADLLRQLESVPVPDDAAEQRKAQAKWDTLRENEGVFVSSQFADVFGRPPSLALNDLKNLLKKSLADPKLAVIQQIE